jgi:predicted AAA+ superfamily ATPase
MYIQVAQTLSEQSTREREIRSLIGIKDGHPKLIISMDPEIVSDYAGIKNRNIVSWLLEPGIVPIVQSGR